ncbi:hypothetical protein MMC08_004964 [Hypocenomyce scalaris]|nr:hypothetical protein [Hypocenomyce scalaris]
MVNSRGPSRHCDYDTYSTISDHNRYHPDLPFHSTPIRSTSDTASFSTEGPDTFTYSLAAATDSSHATISSACASATSVDSSVAAQSSPYAHEHHILLDLVGQLTIAIRCRLQALAPPANTTELSLFRPPPHLLAQAWNELEMLEFRVSLVTRENSAEWSRRWHALECRVRVWEKKAGING